MEIIRLRLISGLRSSGEEHTCREAALTDSVSIRCQVQSIEPEVEYLLFLFEDTRNVFKKRISEFH